MTTPDLEVRALLTNCLAQYLSERELLILGDAVTLILAAALDTALFAACEQPRVSAECDWLRARWRYSISALTQVNNRLREVQAEADALREQHPAWVA
jgi:hypothetical protein